VSRDYARFITSIAGPRVHDVVAPRLFHEKEVTGRLRIPLEPFLILLLISIRNRSLLQFANVSFDLFDDVVANSTIRPAAL